MTLSCPYCGADAELVTGDMIYPHRPDLHSKNFWRCAPCRAWVGCHGSSENALGRLANAELRAWKARAHAAFDPLWQRKMKRESISKKKARGAGYAWLGRQLGVGADECHIGLFDIETCKRVVEICTQPPKTAREASANASSTQPPAPSLTLQSQIPPMRRVGHVRGTGFFGYIYRGAHEPRLSRIDHYSKKPRSVTTTWLVDDEQVSSLEEALRRLDSQPASGPDSAHEDARG